MENIRFASQSDISDLAELGATTFCATFAHLYSQENLSQFLNDFHSEDYYRRALYNPNIKIWIAEIGGHLKAYCMAGPNILPCDPACPNALQLSRIYVLPESQGLNIGAALMNQVIKYARVKNFPQIVLGVYSENVRGHRFYKRYGFEKIGDYYFWVGDHRDHEYIFQKTL